MDDTHTERNGCCSDTAADQRLSTTETPPCRCGDDCPCEPGQCPECD